MQNPVDEERGGALHLARGLAAANVAKDALADRLAAAVAVEARHVKAEVDCVSAQVVVLERPLAVKERLVHLPVAALRRRGLGRQGGGERVRMDFGQGEVAEGEAQAARDVRLEVLYGTESRARVRALAVRTSSVSRTISGG